MSVNQLYPNSPTPNISVNSWDFDPGYDLTLHGAYLNYLFTELNIYLNSASIACGLAVIVIVLLIRSYDPKLVDRVSLRLTVVISAVDVIKGVAYIVFTFIATPGFWCGFTSWLVLFLTNYYTFLSVAIAFNLQWVFLHKRPVYKWLEKFYFILSFVLSLVTSVAPWATGHLGIDPSYGVCWYTSYSTRRTIVWEWASFLSWNIIGTIYCLLIALFVIIKLKVNSWKLQSFGQQSTNSSRIGYRQHRKAQATLNKLVTRISLYALIPFITQGGWYLNEVIMQFGHYLNIGVDFWTIVGTDLPGVFNLIAFLMDPALANSLAYIKNDLLRQYGDISTNDSLRHRNTKNGGFWLWFTRTFLGQAKANAGTSFHRGESAASQETTSYPSANTNDKLGLAPRLANFECESIDDEKDVDSISAINQPSLTHMQAAYSLSADYKQDMEASPGLFNTEVHQKTYDLESSNPAGARNRKSKIGESMEIVFRGL
ncbi:hypothetical protein BC937DRAFT_88031 [Endogone sp. FLAS-F59071]|nr:hypothetical protein BC937DRAFT_88031 [Endogone sp. FLAS-F59071]|eukprot:RUS19064.1 hypothetical protein BC937DRAFT_88031 [Endogone sp. FLAS-F59071]